MRFYTPTRCNCYNIFIFGLFLITLGLANVAGAGDKLTESLAIQGADQIRTREFRTIVEKIVLPVIQSRSYYIEVEERAATNGAKADSDERRPTLVVRTVSIQSGIREVLGDYRIRVVAEPRVVAGHPIHADASNLSTHLVTENGRSYKQVRGVLDLSTRMIEPAHHYEAQGSFRGLLRADPLVNPQSNPVDDPDNFQLSAPQNHIVQQLRTFESKALKRNEPMRAMILLPTGLGKTVIAVKWTAERWERQPRTKRSRVIFILQDRSVLQKIGERFAQMLRLDMNSSTFIQPNNLNRQDLIEALATPSTRAFFVTRSFARSNLDLFQREAARNTLDIIADEAHHVGNYVDDEERAQLLESAQDIGEFQKFFEGLIPYLKSDSQILGLSATPWHRKSDVLERYFGGNLATAFISEPEKARFIHDRDYVNLSRVITLRAMAQGYLSPIYSYKQNLYLDDQTRALDFLRRSGDFFRRTSEAKDRPNSLEGQITVHEPFVQLMFRDIRTTIEQADGYQRGMIFVPSIAHANIYAQMLNGIAQNERLNVRFQAFHSQLAEEDRKPSLDWFQDIRPTGESAPKISHKYMLVVRALTEGFDSPDVNHLLFARPVSTDDLVGMRILLQGLGRGLRVSAYKTQLSIHDYTGRVYDLLFGELDPLLLSRVLLHPKPQRSRPQDPVVVVDKTAVSAQDFVQQEVHAEPALAQAFRQEDGDSIRMITETNPRWYRNVVLPQSLAPILGWPFDSQELSSKFPHLVQATLFSEMIKTIRLSGMIDPAYSLDDILLPKNEPRPEKYLRDLRLIDNHVAKGLSRDLPPPMDMKLAKISFEKIQQLAQITLIDQRPEGHVGPWPGEVRVLDRPQILQEAEDHKPLDFSFSAEQITAQDFSELTRAQDFGPFVSENHLLDIYLRTQPRLLLRFFEVLLTENDPRTVFLRYSLVRSTKSRTDWHKLSRARILAYQTLYASKTLPLVTRTTPEDGPIVGLNIKVVEDLERMYELALTRLNQMDFLKSALPSQVREVVAKRYFAEKGQHLTLDKTIERKLIPRFPDDNNERPIKRTSEDSLILNTDPFWFQSQVVANAVLPIIPVPNSRFQVLATAQSTTQKQLKRSLDPNVNLVTAYKVHPMTRVGNYNRDLGMPPKLEMVPNSLSHQDMLRGSAEGKLTVAISMHFNVRTSDIHSNPPTKPVPYYPDNFDIADPLNGSLSPRNAKTISKDSYVALASPRSNDPLVGSDLDFYESMSPRTVEKMYLSVLADPSPRAKLIRYQLLSVPHPSVLDVLLVIFVHADKNLKLKIESSTNTILDPVSIDPLYLEENRKILQGLLKRMQSYGLPFAREVDRSAIAKELKRRFKDVPLKSICDSVLDKKPGA